MLLPNNVEKDWLNIKTGIMLLDYRDRAWSKNLSLFFPSTVFFSWRFFLIAMHVFILCWNNSIADFYKNKVLVNNMKKQPTKWRKYLHIWNSYNPKANKQTKKHQKRKVNNPIKNWQRTWMTVFKEDVQLANRYLKDVQRYLLKLLHSKRREIRVKRKGNLCALLVRM